jgi:membrane dipeptidase
VPDSILQRLPANGGVVMINFYTGFVAEDYRQWNANRWPKSAAEVAQPGRSQIGRTGNGNLECSQPRTQGDDSRGVSHIERRQDCGP